MFEVLLGVAALVLACGVACTLVIAARQGRVNISGKIDISVHAGVPQSIGWKDPGPG